MSTAAAGQGPRDLELRASLWHAHECAKPRSVHPPLASHTAVLHGSAHMQEAAESMLTSKSAELVPVDSWQASEFARLGVASRDPMFQTLATLLEVGARDDASDK